MCADALRSGLHWAVDDTIVVAADARQTLKRVRGGGLIDIMPYLQITAGDIEILYRWIVDYHRRGLPWAVARRGRSRLVLWKLKRC